MKVKIYFVLLGFLFIFLNRQTVSASETLLYVHQDHLGSTTLMTDSQGRKASKQVYYPYGETRAKEGNLSTERHYTGQVSDSDDTGLLYYNARYYDPVIGKFTQADTADAGSNKYAYVKNNPIVHTDPSGNQGARFDDEIALSEPNETRPGAHRGGGRVPPIRPGPEASLQDIAGVAGIYLAMLSPVFPPLGPLLEIADTSLCFASGGGPECINPLPGTAATTQLDEVVESADDIASTDELITLYKGVSAEADDILPMSLQREIPIDPKEAFDTLIENGFTPDQIAVNHSIQPLYNDPGTSWSGNLEVAIHHAKEQVNGGKVVRMKTLKNQAIHIPDWLKETDDPEYVKFRRWEDEYYILGRIPKESYNELYRFNASNTVSIQ